MRDASRRPVGRLCCWVLVMAAALGLLLPASGAPVPQSSPSTTTVAEQVELGGALELQHGDVSFAGVSQGVIGGLYARAVSAAGCLAGFQVTPASGVLNIQALIQGQATGPVVTTTAGHRYVLTTYLYSMEVYRSEETFHSSVHPAGSGVGGAAIAADVRFVLEVQDIDPSNTNTSSAHTDAPPS